MLRQRRETPHLVSTTASKHPLLAVAQGCTVRRGAVYGGPPAEADDVLGIIDLIESGGRIALVADAEIEHHHVSGLRSFYRKYRSRARASLTGNQGYLRRRRYLSIARRARTWMWPIYSVTIVVPALHGAVRAARYRDPLALYHPVVNTVLFLALLREVVPYLGRRLANRAAT